MSILNKEVMNTTGYSFLRISDRYIWRLCFFKAGILFRPWERTRKMPRPTVENQATKIYNKLKN
jgi:hypothetical protein